MSGVAAYAGIGSRETPPDVLDLMSNLAYALSDGYNLRTGGAEGADKAFEQGHAEGGGTGIELYLSWPNFGGYGQPDAHMVARWEPQAEAYDIAAEHHPAWLSLKRGGRALHARNVHQVLGPDVTAPTLSKFVLCWTPEARGGGGTGQAIRVANAYGVPVFDLAPTEVRARMERWLDAGGLRAA